MIYRVLADLVALAHLLFILFALLGGLLILWRPWLVIVHLPAGIWVSLVSFMGWTCPLTPLENHWRIAAGAVGFEGGFVEHYIIPLIYPVDLTRQQQLLLGALALILNLFIYLTIISRRRIIGRK